MVIFTADVSGHGLPSAILVSLLKSYLHSEIDDAIPLEEFLVRLNGFLHEASLPSQFATALVLRLRNDAVEYASAGHPPFVHYSRATGRCTVHEQAGHLLGAMPEAAFESASLPLGTGDVLFMYTDGLTDRRNREGEFYALERVAGILERNAERSADELFARIRADAVSFAATDELRDDIAFMIARVR